MRTSNDPSCLKKILVAIDFSAYSNDAVEYAATLAKRFGAEIVVVHVIEAMSYSVTDTFTVVDHLGALEKTAGALLENLSARLAEKGIAVKTRLASGVPADEILKSAEAENADLIVMGTRGRTGVSHLALGSVAEKVVLLARRPVLTVRDRQASTDRPIPSVTIY
jgi:nucleotide-binding universal stress UspA family protein